MNILGISAFYHDSAAALVVDGEIVSAVQEERFSRQRFDASFPLRSIQYCLAHSGLRARDVDLVTFYEKPLAKFHRIGATQLAVAPKGFAAFRQAAPAWLQGKLFQRRAVLGQLERLDRAVPWSDRLLFSEHHLSHAASAFFPSPFDDAAILTMDGVGELATTSIAAGSGNRLRLIKEIHFPHSLGLLYSAFTAYGGFRVNSGEYKVMGLAPYGQPRFADLIRERLIDVKEDGSFRLDMSYFEYCTGLRMTNDRFHDLFGGPPRLPESPLSQRDMDLAASIQSVTDEVVLRLARNAAAETGQRKLCLAGGVALNCVANGKLLRSGLFDDIWIQPAAGDAGGAVGAALATHHLYDGAPRNVTRRGDAMKGAFLGPSYEDDDIASRLASVGAHFDAVSDDALFESSARAIADGKAVGWYQGRMEFGPRALGARSILADARAPGMQRTLNLKVKARESFRPFAPAVLRDELSAWFELDSDSRYMLFVADVRLEKRRTLSGLESALKGIEKLSAQRSAIPAVTHVDGSARVQTVDHETNPRFYRLLSRFRDITGCPVVVNTSFNVRGEPIVNTPEEAFRCFMGTGIDFLAIGNFILEKERQDPALATHHAEAFPLD